MRKFDFYKAEDDCWYVDLPEWEGNKAELEMVLGADKMLDYLSKGAQKISLNISEARFKKADILYKLRDDAGVGGAWYLLKKVNQVEINQELWLCEVTRFVFGTMPERIFIGRV